MAQSLFPDRRVLWMDPAGVPGSFADPADKKSHCCVEMRDALVNCCEEHADDPFACPDMLIAYSDTFCEYGLIIHDGGPSYLVISACPFCGTKLPESGREEWFDRLEAMGIDDPVSGEIPEAYRSGAWRRPIDETGT
ncbi:MAG: hypothetical protein KDJ86_02740 [Bauldia sp.]|uniref:DUF6980 family protein n=1 Tax=Bauldia sp. TaxID=2575872 RepID=UPI001D2E0F3D|nr:hypothetical protein [Bauldia sp.]MCB1494678.1 hypothetical protein [Bauldia sp.]